MVARRLSTLLSLAALAAAWVELDPRLIPTIAEPLPVYTLGRTSFLPEDLLKTIVGHSATGPVNFTKGVDGDPKTYLYDGGE
ncbi:hypothetical protein NMY22_g18972 [Coprinellus aureogranulatus]|nr:hypothetical protein NMY22_g18972 [Coprinellus aureogranulatus]